MKIEFGGVEKYQAKSWSFSIKIERTQDVEMKSRSLSTMKVDQPRSYQISQTFHFDHLTEEEKKSYNYKRSDSSKNKFFCSKGDTVVDKKCGPDENYTKLVLVIIKFGLNNFKSNL